VAVALLNAKNLKLLQIVPTVPGLTAAVGQRSIKDSGAEQKQDLSGIFTGCRLNLTVQGYSCLSAHCTRFESHMSSSSQKDLQKVLENYEKTCSIVFAKASQSQMRFIQSFVNLQQSLLTWCQSLTSKQISWLQEYYSDVSKQVPYYYSLAHSVGLINSVVRFNIGMLAATYDTSVVYLDGSKKIVNSIFGLFN
jgi:hypothetical protein